MLKHHCKPLYYARDIAGDYVDEWCQVYANSAEAAAEAWASKFIEGECSVVVVVRDLYGSMSKFTTEAEYTLSYYAREGSLSDEERAQLEEDE